jgi:hypothetical protein
MPRKTGRLGATCEGRGSYTRFQAQVGSEPMPQDIA